MEKCREKAEKTQEHRSFVAGDRTGIEREMEGAEGRYVERCFLEKRREKDGGVSG